MRGYKRVVMCEEVREEVRTVLGEATDIKEYLLALCDDRLVATPWLNRVSYANSAKRGAAPPECPVSPVPVRVSCRLICSGLAGISWMSHGP